MTSAPATEIDAALLDRLRRASATVVWEPAAAGRSRAAKSSRAAPAPRARVARFHDESARVEETEANGRYRLTAESGPLGAMLLLLAFAERGRPTYLAAHVAGELPGFPMGAVEAAWGGARRLMAKGAPRIADLVAVARYALP